VRHNSPRLRWRTFAFSNSVSLRLVRVKAGFAALAAPGLLLVAPAKGATHHLRLQIPFEFTDGNEVLPAGQYEVELDQFPHILVPATARRRLSM